MFKKDFLGESSMVFYEGCRWNLSNLQLIGKENLLKWLLKNKANKCNKFESRTENVAYNNDHLNYVCFDIKLR